MFGQFDENGSGYPGPVPHDRVDALGAVDARLLWAIRRLALMQPIGAARCHAVHIALQQDFGEAGLGIEHLLRCWLVGLSRRTDRPLRLGEPACPLLLPDEAALLLILHSADDVARVRLTALSGPETAPLMPLARSLRQLTQNIS